LEDIWWALFRVFGEASFGVIVVEVKVLVVEWVESLMLHLKEDQVAQIDVGRRLSWRGNKCLTD